MSVLTSLKSFFSSTNQDTVLADYEQNETIPDINQEYVPLNNLSFGSILCWNEDNTEYEISINDPSQFCKEVKIWTGAEDYNSRVKVKRIDSNGNLRSFVIKTNNRIEDKNQTNAIAESIKQNSIMVTTTLHISEIKEEGKCIYLCWDGQHRRGAIKILRDNVDCHSTIKRYFICRIYRNDTCDGIIRKFISINKAVPVPGHIITMLELKLSNYNEPSLEESNNDKIKNTSDLVSLELSRLFSEYCKTSNKPQLPNFNMHNVNQDILNYLKETESYDITPSELIHSINQLNEELCIKYNGMRLNKQLKNRIDKVNSYNTKCYLFIESDNFTNLL